MLHFLFTCSNTFAVVSFSSLSTLRSSATFQEISSWNCLQKYCRGLHASPNCTKYGFAVPGVCSAVHPWRLRKRMDAPRHLPSTGGKDGDHTVDGSLVAWLAASWSVSRWIAPVRLWARGDWRLLAVLTPCQYRPCYSQATHCGEKKAELSQRWPRDTPYI